jgi:hypothetical protein
MTSKAQRNEDGKRLDELRRNNMKTRKTKIGKTAASTCALNGWTVGTVLVGDEGYGPEKIVITAIGEEHILARQIVDWRGDVVRSTERLWVLHRNWKKVGK